MVFNNDRSSCIIPLHGWCIKTITDLREPHMELCFGTMADFCWLGVMKQPSDCLMFRLNTYSECLKDTRGKDDS